VWAGILLLHSLTQKDSIVAHAYEAVCFKKCEQWWEGWVGRNLVVAVIPSTFWKAVWFCGEQWNCKRCTGSNSLILLLLNLSWTIPNPALSSFIQKPVDTMGPFLKRFVDLLRILEMSDHELIPCLS